ncbi:hypothetical protein TNCV_4680061 [Trichonephila clavipes]|nr:hypothetical protein TNCV_4680061 [Trichonephila clavipes]
MGNLEVKKGKRESLRGLLLERIWKWHLSQRIYEYEGGLRTEEFRVSKRAVEIETASLHTLCGITEKRGIYLVNCGLFGISNLRKYHFE